MDAVAVQELFQTAITGIVTVSLIALLFIPHFSAVLFIFPLITILYVDMLGVLQLAGSAINAHSFTILRDKRLGEKGEGETYFEDHGIVRFDWCHLHLCRSWAFSQSEIFSTIFVSFLGLVTLGAGHGLILLPN